MSKFNVNLQFPNMELELHIGNSKKNTKSSVYYSGKLLKKVETKNIAKESELKDGDILNVKLVNNFIVDDNDNEMFNINNSLLDNGIVIDLVKEGNNVKIMCADIVLDVKDASYFNDLFTKTLNYNCAVRNNYKAFVSGINEISIIRYVNTHQHTEYSRLDGMTKLKDIAKKTEWSSAITDHGAMTGVLKFDSCMRAEQKHPIIGMEPYIERIDENIFNDIFVNYEKGSDEEIAYKKEHFKKEHIIMLAKNLTGYKNLIKLASLSWNNFYGKNHIKYSDLMKYSEGIIATSACLGSTIGKTILEDEKIVRTAFFNELGLNENLALTSEIESDFDLLSGDDLYTTSSEQNLLKSKYTLDNYSIITKEIIENLISTNKNNFPLTVEAISNYGKTVKLYLNKMISIFGREDFYIEIQRHNFVSEQYVEKILLKLAKENNIKIVTGIDNHYLNEEDAEIHEMWLCESTGKNLNDPTRMKFPGNGYWLMTSDEVLELFKDIPEAMDNSLEIADKCNVDLKVKGYSLPKYPLPLGYSDSKEDQVKYFKKMVLEGYKNRFLNTSNYTNPIYTERMSFEIKTILKMGFESYFLIVQDYISWANDENVKENIERYFPSNYYDLNKIADNIKNKDYKIYVGPGRGSAAGSLVAYCLGITNINPIEYNLLFERFLNPDRVSMPDIDTDFEDSERENVIDYVKAKYGVDNVSRIGTIGALNAKGVIRSIQRVTGRDISIANQIAKLIPNKPGTTLTSAIEENPELKELYETNDEVTDIIDKALKLEGLSKTVGAHACGLIIAPSEVSNYVPQQLLTNPKTGLKEPTTQFTGGENEDQGLLKMDFLGLRTLGVLHEGIEDINRVNKSEKVTLDNIPITDFEVYKFLSQGDTDGVFQFESPFMKDIVKKMLQDISYNKTLNGEICFNRLADATALGRPGPMATIPDYVENLLHPNAIKLTNTPLDKILKDTYGIIVYQEQVMQAVKDLAGFSAGNADTVRKAMGKKMIEKMAVLREWFIFGNQEQNIPGCIANGYDKQFAIDLWDRMAEFAKYAFNKSHAVAYTYLSIKTAWVAKNYPNIFMKTNLNSFIDNAEKIRKYINVARKKGIQVLTPDVNYSFENFSIDYNNYNPTSPIRFGLRGIKTLGKSSKAIIEERENNGLFKDFNDFVTRMIMNYNFGKKAFEAIIMSGAADSFSGTRKNKVDSLDKLVDSCKAEANELKKGQMTIFQLAKSLNIESFVKQCEELNAIKYDLDDTYSSEEELKKEKEYNGFYISRHPIDEYKDYLVNRKAVDIISITEDTEESEMEIIGEDESDINLITETKDNEVLIGGIIKDLEIRYSKKNNSKIKTFTLEDDTSEIKCVVFSKVLEKCDENIKENNIIILSGKLSSNDFGTQIIVDKANTIADDKFASFKLLSITISKPGPMYQKVTELLTPFKQKSGIRVQISSGNKIYPFGFISYNLSLQENLFKLVGDQNVRLN